MKEDFKCAFQGLSEKEAETILKTDGPNEIPSAKGNGLLHIALEILTEPMFLLLVGCGILYLILGSIDEALMLLGFVVVIMGITFVQERKTQRALEALKDLSSPRAFVIRDGVRRKIAGREVVKGDLIELSEGDRVPADAVLLESTNLSVNESLLTGESVPVRKAGANFEAASEKMTSGKPGGDDTPYIFSGTLIVYGRGLARVTATGTHTELGKIGKSLGSIEEEESGLKKEIDSLVKKLSLAGFILCVIVVIVYGMTRNDWLNGFLAGITLAMAMLPEEFPVVLTIFLALGAWRISQKHVLTRRVYAIETLGSASVLCSDKTGTITQNCMKLSMLWEKGGFYDLNTNEKSEIPERLHELIEFAILASQRDPFDPMEKELRDVGKKYLSSTEHLHDNWTLLKEYALSTELLALSHVWKSPDEKNYEIAAKGSPEAIFDLCHLDKENRERYEKIVLEMADKGLRILGVASSSFTHDPLPSIQHDFTFRFLGFIGFTDPIRPLVPGAVDECRKAGIRVVMITGDYPGTATNISKQAGIENPESVLCGSDIDTLSDELLCEKVKSVNVFARVVPEQKLKIVQAFKNAGQIVAMTGDGVNDAPALKAAHIGIAMGGRGTDVAREASSLVLLDDDFTSIVSAVKLGRRIFQNIQKAMAYIFAIHVPIAGISLIPVLMKWDLILLPAHIVFLELLIDPSCSIVFEVEPGEPDIMEKPPRERSAPLFGKEQFILSLIQGIGVLAVCMGMFVYFSKYRNFPIDECRALTFTTLIVANLFLIIVNRSWKRSAFASLMVPNPAQWFILIGGGVFLGVILYVPFFQKLFKFMPLHLNDISICVFAGILSLVWFEIYKFYHNRSKSV
ncbi:MAG: cation-translocating P-type ATPase [Candidatus Riflebacteria bacterium]|nr:cation-translocating P-type ATPase [Candidatus Riflebacteria bacterium]